MHEVFICISKIVHYVWRAVDRNLVVMDILVQARPIGKLRNVCFIICSTVHTLLLIRVTDPEGTCLARSSPAEGYHCGGKPVISDRHRRTETATCSRSKVLLPRRSLSEQLVEQDHRAVKRRVNACLAFRSSDGAQRTIQGYEAMNMLRKDI